MVLRNQGLDIEYAHCYQGVINSMSSLWVELSVQFSSVTQSCPTLCDPMNRSTPGLPVHQEFTQTHVHRVRDAIQPSHPLSSLLLLPPILPASESFPLSQLFAWGGQSTGVSAIASFLPKKSQGWSPSEWTGMDIIEGYISICYCHKLGQNYSTTDDNQGQTVWE